MQRSVLGSQSVLPKTFSGPGTDWSKPQDPLGRRVIYGDYDESSEFAIWTEAATHELAKTDSVPDASLELELFKSFISMSEDAPPCLSLKYVVYEENILDGVQIELVLRYSDPAWTSEELQSQRLRPSDDSSANRIHERTFQLHPPIKTPNTRLTAISIRCSFGWSARRFIPPSSQRLIKFKQLSILPSTYVVSTPQIFNIHSISQGDPPNKHKRIAWDWKASCYAETKVGSVPWSQTTGPFSYFRVTVNGSYLGEACATQFVLRDEDIEKFSETHDDVERQALEEVMVSVDIEGLLFSGGSIRGVESMPRKALLREREEWVHV
jgi:hypothetical protein